MISSWPSPLVSFYVKLSGLGLETSVVGFGWLGKDLANQMVSTFTTSQSKILTRVPSPIYKVGLCEYGRTRVESKAE